MTSTGGPKRGVGKTRAMVKRAWLQGKSSAAIAKQVGITRAAVNMHLKAMRDAGEIHDGEGAA